MSFVGEPKTQLKFRTNPIEILILSVIGLIFFNSVYNLFYGQQSVKITAADYSAGVATSSGRAIEGRGPASIVASMPGYANVDVRCENDGEHGTSANKVRLAGELCGVQSLIDGNELSSATVVNEANKFTATVFSHGGSYSTDYIPLNSGKNPIRVEFVYRGGKKHSQDIVVSKTE
jgi:hypothetical protein